MLNKIVLWCALCAVSGFLLWSCEAPKSTVTHTNRIIVEDGECWVVPVDKTKFESLFHGQKLQECTDWAREHWVNSD